MPRYRVAEGRPAQHDPLNSESTRTERHLAKLCGESFLRLWSHFRPYRDQRDKATAAQGKELCDVLVVFERDVFMFSDKECAYPTGTDPSVAWKRWYRHAIQGSVDQLRGAERWIRKHPDRVFMDKACSTPLPVEIPRGEGVRFHRIVVAHGAAAACRAHFGGGSGALVINTMLMGSPSTPVESEVFPFTVGMSDPEVGFVHVLDEVALERVLINLDTIVEFRDYLLFKEDLVASGKHLIASGEDDLLGAYLANGAAPGKKGHGLGDTDEADVIAIPEGSWSDFERSPEKAARDFANRESYLWDGLIERFAKHAVEGTQYFASSGGPQRTERVLRILAAESRTARRALVRGSRRLLERLGDRPFRVSLVRGREDGGTCYLLLVLRRDPGEGYPEYRERRLGFLKLATAVARLVEPGCTVHVGIGMGPLDDSGSSEDVLLIDNAVWSEDLANVARRFQNETGILTKMRRTSVSEKEYPLPEVESRPKGSERNAPCPCGSGRKWKRCCART